MFWRCEHHYADCYQNVVCILCHCLCCITCPSVAGGTMLQWTCLNCWLIQRSVWLRTFATIATWLTATYQSQAKMTRSYTDSFLKLWTSWASARKNSLVSAALQCVRSQHRIPLLVIVFLLRYPLHVHCTTSCMCCPSDTHHFNGHFQVNLS